MDAGQPFGLGVIDKVRLKVVAGQGHQRIRLGLACDRVEAEQGGRSLGGLVLQRVDLALGSDPDRRRRQPGDHRAFVPGLPTLLVVEPAMDGDAAGGISRRPQRLALAVEHPALHSGRRVFAQGTALGCQRIQPGQRDTGQLAGGIDGDVLDDHIVAAIVQCVAQAPGPGQHAALLDLAVGNEIGFRADQLAQILTLAVDAPQARAYAVGAGRPADSEDQSLVIDPLGIGDLHI